MTQSARSAHVRAAASSAAGSTGSTGEDQVTVVLLLFAEARVAAGTGRQLVEGRTVADVLQAARSRYGEHFSAVLDRARVWVNGDPAGPDHPLAAGDEVAVLPPVSGGAGPAGSPWR